MSESVLVEKSGRIEEIIYHNAENAYTVAVVENEAAKEQFTIVGYMPGISQGREVRLKGLWKTHPKYGEQLSVQEYSEDFPSDIAGIEAFLAGGAISGIGPKTARSIVEAFGERALTIIQEAPESLTQISGIGASKAKIIAESFAQQHEYAGIALFFQKYGISAVYASKIYKVYGAASIEAIKENPYRLVDDLFGVGFKKADMIAEKFGIEGDSAYRIACGVQYVLARMVSEGHTFYPKKQLEELAAQLLDVSAERISEEITAIALSGEITLENRQGRVVAYLPAFAYAEKNVCRQLMMLSKATPKPVQGDVDGFIKKAEIKSAITLADNQRKAVRTAALSGVCVITGGPGTGKTTIINALLAVFENCGMKTAIAAPTGRAAKRITETTGKEAKTIHRLLEYAYSESDDLMSFGKNADNPLAFDAVIVDEASMIDILLMNGLLTAMTYGTRLIIVGDADQLPSVGAGNVLRDIITSDMLTCIRLTEIFRQAKESMIVVNAHQINKGEYPSCNSKGTDFFLLRETGEKAIVETVKELCTSRLPAHFTGMTPADIQILTPTRKGALGCVNLNKEMQALLNPPKAGLAEKEYKDKLFRCGDRVMQIKNNYDLKWKDIDDYSVEGEGVFNGDLGVIHSMDNENGLFNVLYEDKRFVSYDGTQLDELELAYAITVHKSQGSEFPLILMPLTWFPPMLANRNLLYTAVTRAKKAVVLIGSENVMMSMVDNNQILERYSGLAPRMAEFIFT